MRCCHAKGVSLIFGRPIRGERPRFDLIITELVRSLSRWIEIPAEGAALSHEDKSPAPGVKLLPKP